MKQGVIEVDGVSKHYVFNFKGGEENGPLHAVWKVRVEDCPKPPGLLPFSGVKSVFSKLDLVS